MNSQFFRTIPWSSLVLLWLAYVQMGWCLSAHHIVWLVGIFIAAVAFSVAWKSNPLVECLVRFFSQGFLVALVLSLLFSTLVALAATWSMLLPLIVIPLAATVLADLEMGLSGFSKLGTFLFFTALAGLGLAVGEMIDIVVLPSSRY
jgi:hypothetical protein